MTALWILVISRVAICLAAGEIAIRYAAWAALLFRSGERLMATPLILGVALWAAARFGIEGRWMILMASPQNAAKFNGLTEGDLFSEVMRILLFVALCFMTYPVTKIVYRYRWERALVESVVRTFLIVVSITAGWVFATIHFFHVR